MRRPTAGYRCESFTATRWPIASSGVETVADMVARMEQLRDVVQ
jgi:hypothetical protein